MFPWITNSVIVLSEVDPRSCGGDMAVAKCRIFDLAQKALCAEDEEKRKSEGEAQRITESA